MGAGDIKFSFANGLSFTLKNVHHVPKLTKSLILASQLNDSGYQTIFGFQSWKIQKGFMVLARGAKTIEEKQKKIYTLCSCRQHYH